MASVVNGILQPRIVLKKNNNIVDDFTLERFESGPDSPDPLMFFPIFVKHELDNDDIVSLFKGFRMEVQIFYPELFGDELYKIRKLYDRRQYDTVLFYPWATDKPYYYEIMKLVDEAVNLSYSFALNHRNFLLKLESVKIVDYVPLEKPEFLTWGNITLKFSDLNTLPFSSYMRTVTRVIFGSGSILSTVSGYFKDGSSEGVNGQFVGVGAFQTDLLTYIKFTAQPDPLYHFVQWRIDGQPYSSEPEIELQILNDIEIKAEFEL